MISGVISTFQTGTYTMVRTAAGSYDDDGELTAGTNVFTDIAASVQPITGRELMNMPEGQHGAEMRVLYTVTELRARTGAGAGDRIIIAGETWEVVRCETWPNHTRAYISRTGLGAPELAGALAGTLGALTVSAGGTVV